MQTHRVHRLGKAGILLALCPCMVGFAAPTAEAIPTPDVMVNVFTGMAQGLMVLAGALAALAVAFLRALRRPGALLRKIALPSLLLLLVGSVGYNYYQMRASEVDRSARLSRNLVRGSTQNGLSVQDVSLEVLPRSEQDQHPLGLTTEQVAELTDSRTGLLIDVRETEEFDAGTIAGTLHQRYPDLAADPAVLRDLDHAPVLLCYSGNRSGELARKFTEQGIECRFMIGGYEKWNV